MALPPSGTMTLAMIAAEFGGGTPHSISEYYRGGGLVPNIAANAAIPTSGIISFSNFYNATNFVATAPNGSVSHSVGSGTASAGLSLQDTGANTFNVGNSVTVAANWGVPNSAGVGAGWHVRATLASGSTPSSGTMGTWLQLNTPRSWGNTQGSPGTRTSTITFELSNDGGSTVYSSGSVILTADRS